MLREVWENMTQGTLFTELSIAHILSVENDGTKLRQYLSDHLLRPILTACDWCSTNDLPSALNCLDGQYKWPIICSDPGTSIGSTNDLSSALNRFDWRYKWPIICSDPSWLAVQMTYHLLWPVSIGGTNDLPYAPTHLDWLWLVALQMTYHLLRPVLTGCDFRSLFQSHHCIHNSAFKAQLGHIQTHAFITLLSQPSSAQLSCIHKSAFTAQLCSTKSHTNPCIHNSGFTTQLCSANTLTNPCTSNYNASLCWEIIFVQHTKNFRTICWKVKQ